MSAAKVALLGAVAGFTIFLGLSIGRLRSPAPRLRALLNATVIGVLLFLRWDILAHVWEPVDMVRGLPTAPGSATTPGQVTVVG